MVISSYSAMKYIGFVEASSSYFFYILHLSLVTFFLVTFLTETETREYQNLFLLFISSYFPFLHKFQMSCLKFILFLFLKKKSVLNMYSAWTLKICIATSLIAKLYSFQNFLYLMPFLLSAFNLYEVCLPPSPFYGNHSPQSSHY